MMIIDETLNSTKANVKRMFEQNDVEVLQQIICTAASNGAEYMDVNAAMCAQEEETLLFMMDLLDKEGMPGMSIDTADLAVARRVLLQCRTGKVLVNSVSLDRFDEELAELIARKNAGVVVLPLGIKRKAENTDAFMDNACMLIEKLECCGIARGKIFVDVLVGALCADSLSGKRSLDFLAALKKEKPDVHSICGLSNISFSLPGRSGLNAVFLALLQDRGLDSVILDSCDMVVQSALVMTKALLGNDGFLKEYIAFFRNCNLDAK